MNEGGTAMYVAFVEELQADSEPLHTARTLEQAFAQIASGAGCPIGSRVRRGLLSGRCDQKAVVTCKPTVVTEDRVVPVRLPRNALPACPVF
jgi:hypothetical protein